MTTININTLIYFLSSFSGLLCFISIFFRQKNKKNILINKYFLSLIAIATLRFAGFGIIDVVPELAKYRLDFFLNVLIIMLGPSLGYLYLQDVVYRKKITNTFLLHSIAPLVILTATILFLAYPNNYFFKNLLYLVSFLTALLYTVLCIRIFYLDIWMRKSEIKIIQDQNKVINIWLTYFIFISVLLPILIRIPIIYINYFVYGKTNAVNSGLWFVALFWMFTAITILINPRILYGYGFYARKIGDKISSSIILEEVWSLDSAVIEISNIKDQKLTEKVFPNLLDYIHKVEEVSFYGTVFRMQDVNIDDLANAINIPSSHVTYLFKYHCKESFTNYKKIIRIQDSIKLINSDFIKTRTIESLAVEVGFTSYTPFFLAFKNITGLSPNEYLYNRNSAPAKETRLKELNRI